MEKGKAFIVVGHSNWGKSRTLKALTDGSTYTRSIKIKLKDFFIRRTSNCDKPNSFKEFINNIDQQDKPFLIITLCPDFGDPAKKTEVSIQELYKKYQLFFFILKHKYKSDEIITATEIARLKLFGEIKIFGDKDTESEERAAIFKDFILNHI